MQDGLFPDAQSAASASAPASPRGAAAARPAAQPPDAEQLALAAALPGSVHLGTSSWSYPGWAGLVWARRHGQALLAKQGLHAYGRHPLLRTVSIDRGFYRPLSASQYEHYAAQVPESFRFTVKAPALVCDPQLRGEDGRGREPNPAFLDPALALQEFVGPALQGLGPKVGALVFQLSPLCAAGLANMDAQLDRLERLLAALPALPALGAQGAPDGVIAVEVRNPEWLCPRLIDMLRAHGATYCLGLHPKLPPIEQQLWLLRALWPGPLVCRWNLNRIHGPYGHAQATQRYGEFDQCLDPDPELHAALARVVRGTAGAGHKAYLTISNEAEGCAPLSVLALARAIVGGA